MADKTIRAKLELDAGDYTSGMGKASRSNDQYAASAVEVQESTLRNVEAFREAKDLIGDMDSSVKGMSGSLEHFGVVGEKGKRKIDNMAESSAFLEGVMRPFTQFMILATARTMEFAAALGAVATAGMAVGATISAMTAQSEEEKALWITMTAVLWGLTAAQTAYAIAKTAAQTTILSPGAIAVVVGAITAGTIAAIGAIAALKSAQSTPESPTVIRTHYDEEIVVSRGGSGGSGGGTGRPINLFALQRNHAELKRVLRSTYDIESSRSGV